MKTDLSGVKSAILYERVSDGVVFGRSVDEVVDIVEETDADLILRSFFRWEVVPESSDATIPGYPASYVKQKVGAGYSYEQYGEAIRQIKARKPDTLIIGAIAAQRLNQIEVDDVSGESFSQAQTFEMALDPQKFGVSISKAEGQRRVAQLLHWSDKAPAYFPDITNEQYQELLLSRAKKQIDLGVDGIWIDMLFSQASLLQRFSADDSQVKKSYDAAAKIVDDIHAYGYAKYNKRVYVGTWSSFAEFPYPPPDVDFVTATPKSEEITSGLDERRWDNTTSAIKAKLGDVPIFAFIDWTEAGAPIDVFSQKLTPAQQSEFIRTADAFFARKGIIFAYPVHGGTFPQTSARLSFGKYGVYDSLAPEFQTYDVIKELAQNKSE
jgi:hypothetical protein